MRTRLIITLAIAAVAALWSIAPASANAGGSAVVAGEATAAETLAGDVRLNFKVNRFVNRSGRLVAKGTAIGTYTSSTGQTYRVTKPITMQVVRSSRSMSRICEVLTLRLNALEVNLLGLIIRLERPLVLRITANSRGGILGSLLCSLAGRNVLGRQQATTAARKLTRTMGGQTVGSTNLTAPINTQAAQQPGACPILNLVLGPLDLRVLGLRVHLNLVHLTISANRGALLGDLLCGLTTPLPVPIPPPPAA